MGNRTSTSSDAGTVEPVTIDPAFIRQLQELRDVDTHLVGARTCVPRAETRECLEEGARLLTALQALANTVAAARQVVQQSVTETRTTLKQLQLVYKDYVSLIRALENSGAVATVAAACTNGAAELQASLATCSQHVSNLQQRLAGLAGGRSNTLCVLPHGADEGDAICYDTPLTLPSVQVALLVDQLHQDVAAHAEAAVWLHRATLAAKTQQELIDKQNKALQKLLRTSNACPAETVHQVSAAIQQLSTCQATTAELETRLQAAAAASSTVVEAVADAGIVADGTGDGADDGQKANPTTVAAAAHTIAAASLSVPVTTGLVVESPSVSAIVTAEDAVAHVVQGKSDKAAVQHAATLVSQVVVDVVRMNAKDVAAQVSADLDSDPALFDAPVRNPSYLRGFILAFFQSTGGSAAAAKKQFDDLVASVKRPVATKPVTAATTYVSATAAPPVEFALAFEPLRRRLILRRLLAADPLVRDALEAYLASVAQRSRGIKSLTAGMRVAAPMVTLEEWGLRRDGLAGGQLAGGVILVSIGSDGRFHPTIMRRYKGKLVPVKAK